MKKQRQQNKVPRQQLESEVEEIATPKDTKETVDKYATDWKLELFALSGFCLSGVIFIVSGFKSGDYLTVLGSTVWIISCVIWMIPYRKYF